MPLRSRRGPNRYVDPSNVLKAGARPSLVPRVPPPRRRASNPKTSNVADEDQEAVRPGLELELPGPQPRARAVQNVGAEVRAFYKVHPKDVTRRVADAPVFVVWESTDEAAIKEQFSTFFRSRASAKHRSKSTHSLEPTARPSSSP